MKRKLVNFFLVGILIFVVPIVSAEKLETTKVPNYPLKVTINNQQVVGFVELMSRFPDSDPNLDIRKPEFDRVFDESMIHVKKGQQLSFKLELGDKDVTNDSGLYVEFIPKQMRLVAPNKIVVESEEGLSFDGGIVSMWIYCRLPSNKIAFNRVFFYLNL